MLSLIERAGEFATRDIWHATLQLITNYPELHEYAARKVGHLRNYGRPYSMPFSTLLVDTACMHSNHLMHCSACRACKGCMSRVISAGSSRAYGVMSLLALAFADCLQQASAGMIHENITVSIDFPWSNTLR